MVRNDFIKTYNPNSDIGFILVNDLDSPEYLHSLKIDLPFLPGKIVTDWETKLVLTFYIKKIAHTTYHYYRKLKNMG